MAEIWLRSNRRALALGLLLPSLLAIAGLLLLTLTAPLYVPASRRMLANAGTLGCLGIAWQMRQPRLAVANKHLLIYARSGPPYQVPIDVVEGFLLGQGPSLLPGRRYQRTETSTFVVRLAESAEEWAQPTSILRWANGAAAISRFAAPGANRSTWGS